MATLLKDVAVGSLVKINENGAPVDFYVACHDYEAELNGTGRTLLVRKDCYDQRQWHNSTVNTYANSAIDTWLNSDYKALLDTEIQEKISNTTFYYTPGNGSYELATLTRDVFLLSYTELGFSGTQRNVEGSTLPTASTLKIAKLNNSAVAWWTRTPLIHTSSHNGVEVISQQGSTMSAGVNTSYGSRPAFTLPTNGAIVLDDGSISIRWGEVSISTESTDLGTRPNSFNIDYTIFGNEIITELFGTSATVTEKVNDTVIRTYTATSGEPQTMSVVVSKLIDGEHTAIIAADVNGVTTEQVCTFTVPAFVLNDCGTVQEFQDETGASIFPATMAKAVMTADGKSTERKLMDLTTAVESILPNYSKIQTGSYTGTGAYGTGNFCRVTFKFVPKMFIVTAYHTSRLDASNSSAFWVGQEGGNGGEPKFMLNEKTLSWYSTQNAAYQCNSSTYKYYWVAFA